MSFRSDRVFLVSIGAGVVLTGLLLWVLSSSVEPVGQVDSTASEVSGVPPRGASSAAAVAPSFVPSVVSTAGKQVNTGKAEPAPAPVVTPVSGVESPSGSIDPAPPAALATAPDPVPLPPELLLSPQEISALSKQEREKYEHMLEAYQRIQAQTERLRQEREHLENRVEDMEDRNKSLTGELKDVRELLKETPEQ